MDIGRAFNFPFQDPRWVTKVLIGGVLILIPIFGWFTVFGYTIRVMRNVVSGSDVPLPEWDDFGGMFVEGIKAFVIALVWSIPAIIISAIVNSSDNVALSCLSAIVSAATNLFVLSATVNFARSGRIEDGFQFQDTISRVISNIGDYIIIFLLSFVLAIIAAAGLIGLCIGVLFTIFYTALVNAHLGAQAYLRSIGASAPPARQAF
jgi:hypothetical protein